MKLASLRNASRDGQLLLVSRDLRTAVTAADIAPDLQHALDHWEKVAAPLAARYRDLNQGKAAGAFAFDAAKVGPPLPRAYQFVDGSGYQNHGELMKKAFDTSNSIAFPTDQPLMYQACSDDFMGPCDPIEAGDEGWGIDFEGELAVIVGDVPRQTARDSAAAYIRLVMLANDVSLRNLIMAELAKGFGFYQSKPASSFSPVAVTPDELGEAWRESRLLLPLRITLNGKEFGRVNAGIGATFSFPDFIAHATRTRKLAAGTIIGGGTVSNSEPGAGSSCIAERRALERIQFGEARTPFLKFGDHLRIEMLDASGQTVFGAIDQKVVQFARR
jgi:fumarylacetoacetate (FAA) hydrolase